MLLDGIKNFFKRSDVVLLGLCVAASVYGPRCTLAQGLGTGQLYTDNIEMDIEMRRDKLWRSPIAQ